MKKKLFFVALLSLLLSVAPVSAVGLEGADDPPVWDKCATTPCP